MVKEVIEIDLSPQSFAEAARKIREYRDSLESKVEEFCHEVANTGMEVINAVLSEHVDTGATIGSVTLEETGSGTKRKARVVVSSDAILFLEFGSGLVGQGTAPHAGEFGMGSGTYPGKGHWADTDITVRYGDGSVRHYDQGWVYYDEAGRKRVSEGMVAAMPMYLGGKAMEEALQEIAGRVFNG